METYSERLERVRAMTSQPNPSEAVTTEQPPDKPSGQPETKRRRQRNNQTVRKRPGKRQRAAAKEQAAGTAP